jgi:DNA-directed RNA polymerase subunit K/omega
MQDLLQKLDLDYYRLALLLAARAELERLRQERSTSVDVETRSKLPLGTSLSADSAISPEVARAGLL